MRDRLKENISLLIGLAIPVLMILFIAVAVYFPRWFSTVEPPKHDFLYLVGDPYGDIQYSVRGGKLVKEKIQRPQPSYRRYRTGLETRFFIHRIRTNRSEEVTFENATKLKLDSKVNSPDGYSIVHGRRAAEFFPFFGRRDYRARYLKKDSYTEKLKIETSEDYPYNFRFLGWVVE